MNAVTASIVTIGDELLIGQTIDTNSAWIAQRMNELGICINRRVAVGDTIAAITQALDEEMKNCDILFLTGGLGPTADDITKPLLCDYFGGTLIVNQDVVTHLHDLFAARKRFITARNLKQAEVPDVCEVLFNKAGTAPGMWFEKNGKVVIALPGVPSEMKHIMSEVALPKIAAQYTTEKLIHKHIFTAGEGESMIADKLEEIESRLPEYIKLAYLPDAGFVRLRLTGKSKQPELLETEITYFQREIVHILGSIVVATDSLPLEFLLIQALEGTGKTISTAESCTGGGIGSAITNVPGSSTFYMGGVVAYSNEVKEHVLGVQKNTIVEYGAVSEQTVTEMAIGIQSQLKTNYAVAVSGVLGPNGGTERVKVGTVWMAFANETNVVTKEFKFHYDRERNKDMAIKNALLNLLRLVQGKLG